MRYATVLICPIAVLALITHTNAFACPPQTVFSAYQGSGLCLYAGKGTLTAAHCVQTHASCPEEMERHYKASDPDHIYCCTKEIHGLYGTGCAISQCAQLLTAVEPPKEAVRVFRNCVIGCNGSHSFYCPDGRRVPNGTKC
jgi:hypothetical protein